MARLRDEGEAEHELDVRGLRADEALERLEGFLDRALLHGLSRVQVIHGAGTGALRAAVRERLSQHPTVKDWSAPSGARGNGATVVRLA